MLMCEFHTSRLKQHHCCPFCDQFCTQGDDIVLCLPKPLPEQEGIRCSNKECSTFRLKNGGEVSCLHFFHKSCAIKDALSVMQLKESPPEDIPAEEDDWERWKMEVKCPHCGANGDNLKLISLELRGFRSVIYVTEKPGSLR
jgi:rubredoxin